MHLKSTMIDPPGGWRFRHDNGFVSRAITEQSLVSKVAQYRANNAQPTVSEGFSRLSEEVEHKICEALSPGDQAEYCDGGIPLPKSIGWGEVKKFLLTMSTWALKGLQVVPQEEATRRAAICALCPYNVGTSGCGTCRSALVGLRTAILKGTTPHDSKLQACGVCGCDNTLQVHVPLEVLNQVKTDLVYPSHCWKREIVAAD